MSCPLSDNLLLVTDSYKVTHHVQYPPDTTIVYSYFESRGGKFPKTVFFGLQYIIKRWLCGRVITKEKITEAEQIYKLHFNANHFNRKGWEYVCDKHKGHLPIRIKAVAEGSVIPYHNVLFTIENTDPKCFWLTSYLETLLVQVWYPLSVATNSRYQKELIARYLSETADNLDGLPFKLHDFGFRGSTSVESAGIGGAAHLVNFVGTDNIASLVVARQFYGCKMGGFSIPAAEHSTMVTWGRENELEACRHMLQAYPEGLVSVVSDSYDICNACENIWGKELKDLIEKRGEKGTLIVRPDSGDPAKIVVQVLDILGERFGYTKNTKGYKLLPPYLRIIQGDGITYESMSRILESTKLAGWSTDNMAMGSGGALLQKLDRDTQKCAFKCSYVVINGKENNVYKQPITDPGKNSKKGRLTLERDSSGEYVTKQEGTGNPARDLLLTVFENGKLLKNYTLEEIRENAQIDLLKDKK